LVARRVDEELVADERGGESSLFTYILHSNSSLFVIVSWQRAYIIADQRPEKPSYADDPPSCSLMSSRLLHTSTSHGQNRCWIDPFLSWNVTRSPSKVRRGKRSMLEICPVRMCVVV
jgi:hypothetical protein